jgi:hypothetical protein
MTDGLDDARSWPALDWEQWQATAETLHMFSQIVGKTRLALTPRSNHWWNVPLYVTVRGLGTSAMPLPSGDLLDIEFDFIGHELKFRCSSGQTSVIALVPQSVASFFAAFRRSLAALSVDVAIDPMPVECRSPIRFDLDEAHGSYDSGAVERFHRTLCLADTLFKEFSTRFYGKVSPVHFFWGSFDLAVTRFNGRRAPPRPGADAIQAEAYSHECISTGFWPGNGGYGMASFYCYAAPVPHGLADSVLSGLGTFDRDLGEFVLHYDDVRRSISPSKTVARFLQEAYAACADSAHWDRANLDRDA